MNESPTHPLRHIQFSRNPVAIEDPPFVGWRLPFGVTEPEEIVRLLVAQAL